MLSLKSPRDTETRIPQAKDHLRCNHHGNFDRQLSQLGTQWAFELFALIDLFVKFMTANCPRNAKHKI